MFESQDLAVTILMDGFVSKLVLSVYAKHVAFLALCHPSTAC
jgi:hypothetical protein